MKHLLIKSSAALVAAFLFISCGKNQAVKTEMFAPMAKTMKMSARADSAMNVMQDMAFEESTELPSESEQPRQDRKLIYTGNLTIEVSNLSDSKSSVESWIKKFGGYISDSFENTSSIRITAKIPSGSFSQAMQECGQIGKLKSKNINSSDVTEQFYDLDTRLSTRKVLLERLKKYLSEAKDMQDMLKIETKINDVTSELERMQGQMNRLKSQIDYSTIYVTAELPVNQNESGFVMPDTNSQLRQFFANILNFFVKFIFTALYIVIFGVPSVLFLMLIYWLGFGKVGLLRKLFARIRK